ncbi:hypothetical protein UFOVP3_59 [uncultured Caudovirales phage]|uniref:Uncharacterized protein n=1 Tax=uncultured Caudovirales phage TaxID=2100421 RepID=A0A6J5T7J5_9CAUD|nr:hypothetical protein UFOVP3_59 [uncultured Caudovirales phage]
MQNAITNLEFVKDSLNIAGAIEDFLWDEIAECEWDSVESIVNQLETASCNAGSWSGMIYTHDILERFQDIEWVNAIEQAIEDYQDACDEMPNLGKPFDLSSLVTFAVDWTASELANRLRSNGKAWVVTYAINSLDPKPMRVAFLDEWEAQEWVDDNVTERVQHIVDHSPYTISEYELESIRETEMSLVQIETERL